MIYEPGGICIPETDEELDEIIEEQETEIEEWLNAIENITYQNPKKKIIDEDDEDDDFEMRSEQNGIIYEDNCSTKENPLDEALWYYVALGMTN